MRQKVRGQKRKTETVRIVRGRREEARRKENDSWSKEEKCGNKDREVRGNPEGRLRSV